MADDITPTNPESELPTPDESPFFAPVAPAVPNATAPEAADPEPPADATTDDIAAGSEAAATADSASSTGAAEPDSTSPESPLPDFAAEQPAAEVDLGATAPHDFRDETEVDPASSQLTQLIPPVEAAAEIPPFDPQAAQMTQLVPVVAEQAAPETPAAVVAPLPTVVAGSRVVIVVSRGASPIPPAAVVAVPHVIGTSQGEALGKLQEAGLSAQVFNEYSELTRGEVTAQMPEFGQTAAAGSEAVLLVSGGPAPELTLSVPLPDVVGLSEADALARIQAGGLSPQVVRDFSANVPLGIVVAQLPSGHSVAEAPRKKGSLWWLWTLLVIAVLVAMGGGIYYYLNRTAAVPNVVGLSQAQAEQAITAAGFKLGSIATTQTISASEVGKVTTQTPSPDTQVKLIDQVNIVVSGGQKLFSIPDVTAKSQAEARSILTSAGLQVSSSTAYSTTVPKDSVISQSPGAGEKVPSGTTVGLTVSLGVQSVTVPGLQNMTTDQARNALKVANLSSVSMSEFTLTGTTKTLVFGQFPATGQAVAPGTIVGFLVSNGPPSNGSTATVSVPPVVGKTKNDAINALSKVTLSNTIVNWSGTGRPAGEVVGQAPGASEIVPKKVAVMLFVSNGK
ncbi:MAG: PASTA domain-containing protein [Coriobacteriia bacterium]|nr:PASTA domain-containing protein [Coriobacteriia bacterium]